MEEDAGKLVHAGSDRLAGSTHSLVDYNRAGVALADRQQAGSGTGRGRLSTPRDPPDHALPRRLRRKHAGGFPALRRQYFRASWADAPFGTKVEIKNMNSFSAIQKACEYEIKRQVKAIEAGETIVRETRLWDEGKQLTKSMRSKERASDYRYFPDPTSARSGQRRSA